jgi:hypothetical protein
MWEILSTALFTNEKLYKRTLPEGKKYSLPIQMTGIQNLKKV